MIREAGTEEWTHSYSVEWKCLGNMGRGDVKVEDHCWCDSWGKAAPRDFWHILQGDRVPAQEGVFRDRWWLPPGVNVLRVGAILCVCNIFSVTCG